jgi:hypothetical protein
MGLEGSDVSEKMESEFIGMLSSVNGKVFLSPSLTSLFGYLRHPFVLIRTQQKGFPGFVVLHQFSNNSCFFCTSSPIVSFIENSHGQRPAIRVCPLPTFTLADVFC